MDGSTVTRAELVETSFRNLRENRDSSARWLAVEVLLSDPDALGDEALVSQLIALQDRLEQQARVRYGLS